MAVLTRVQASHTKFVSINGETHKLEQDVGDVDHS